MSKEKAPRIIGLTLAGAAVLGGAACGGNTPNQNKYGVVATATPSELPPSYQPTAPSTEATPPSARQSAPVEINPNLCKVISAEHIAKLLHISTDAPELKSGMESCQGLDGVISRPDNFIASALLHTTVTEGVYNNLYTIAPNSAPQDSSTDPHQFVKFQKEGIDKVQPGLTHYETFTVNGGAGEMVSTGTSTWAQVDMNNGGQALEFNFSVSPPVTLDEATTYLAGVEADILTPQTKG